MSKLKRIGVGSAAIVVLLAVVALGAWLFPRPLRVDDAASRYAGPDVTAAGHSLVEYRADYGRWTAVLGATIQSSTAKQSATRTVDGTIDLMFEFSPENRDFMRLREPDLVLAERAFGQEGGPGQKFRRQGTRLDVEVTSADGSSRDLSFDYPVLVFEPSLLELPFALLDLPEDREGLLAWSNFGDPDDHWLPFRTFGRETVAAAGRDWDTLRVRVAFPDGRQRDYWVADEPPYKIRMVAYENGSLVTTGWDLTRVEVFD